MIESFCNHRVIFVNAMSFIQALKRRVSDFFTGPVVQADNHDPLLDVVRQYPDEAVWFIRVVMFFGSISGILISIPCGVFLAMYWSRCGFCNRPLRYWVLFHCVLQLLQAPVRLVFFFRLSAIQRQNGNVQECVRQLTYSAAWRTSKTISIITYGWFILGVVWILNSTYCKQCPGLYRLSLAVIFTAVARLLITLVCFYHSFPPRFRQPAAPKPRGATQSIIDELPARDYHKDLCAEDASCAICLSEFDLGDVLRKLPCKHDFHRHCIDKWLKKNQVCPLCLQDIQVDGKVKSL